MRETNEIAVERMATILEKMGKREFGWQGDKSVSKGFFEWLTWDTRVLIRNDIYCKTLIWFFYIKFGKRELTHDAIDFYDCIKNCKVLNNFLIQAGVQKLL